jgi:hypothetical protein
MFSEQIYQFYSSLKPPEGLPAGVGTLFPQGNAAVMKLVKAFLDKYYSDNKVRTLILGINPGRFGAGTTGINFTASRQLNQYCGINNELKQQSELSAEFIYEVIQEYGGSSRFYSDFFLSSVSPLGFIREGKNMNYYDDKRLQEAVTPFIVNCINQQYAWNFNRRSCICIGGEKNFKFLSALNEKHNWFKDIYALPHPRFIQQYRRKQKPGYIRVYLEVLGKAKKEGGDSR